MFLTTRFLYPILVLLAVGAANTALDLQQKANASEVTIVPAPGQVNEIMKISNPFTQSRDTRLVLSLKDRRVYLYHGDTVQVSYPVAVGKQGWETPTGSFEIIQKIENPTWEHPWNGSIVPPGPNNPLGQRWIGFWTDGENFIGFHGTTAENLIGQAVSHGCVRMKNRDIVALFSRVEVGTSVVVEP